MPIRLAIANNNNQNRRFFENKQRGATVLGLKHAANGGVKLLAVNEQGNVFNLLQVDPDGQIHVRPDNQRLGWATGDGGAIPVTYDTIQGRRNVGRGYQNPAPAPQPQAGVVQVEPDVVRSVQTALRTAADALGKLFQ